MRSGNKVFSRPGADEDTVRVGTAGIILGRENDHRSGTKVDDVGGSTHAPRTDGVSDSSSTWGKTILGSPMPLTVSLQEEDKVNREETISEVLEAQNSKRSVDVKVTLPKVSEDMQWEDDTRQVKEPVFKFQTKLPQTPKKHGTATGVEQEYSGPVAMSYEAKVGWTAEPIGPNSKHWKRLARDSKGKSISDGPGLASKKRKGPIPLQELDPNIADLKKRKGSAQKRGEWKDQAAMVGGEAEAAAQPRRAQ